MYRTALLFLAPIAFWLSACSSAPQVNSAVLSAATSRGVAAATTAKMSGGERLDISDIRNLVAAHVPDDKIIAYLNSTQQVCNFSESEMATLKAAGADAVLLGFLSETRGFFGHQSAPQNRRSPRAPGQYTNSRLYQDEQPFAYNEPAIDGFYDSGYEESLYSPFSFN